MAKQTFTTGQVLTAAQMTSLQQTAMLGGAANARVASYVLVAADAGDAITMSNASPTTITVNTGLFAAGDTVTIINLGAGATTITAGTATVTTSGSLVLATNQGGVLRFTSASAAIFFQFATPASGDIEGVTAGTGISGGGTSGTVTVTNSMATAIDAKGDLIAGTGADTFARLAVGTNGHTLVADSGETTGLRWSAPSSGALVLVKAPTTFTNVANTGTTFDGVFTSTYQTYVIVIENIIGATDTDDLLFNFRYAGPSTQTAFYSGAIRNDYLATTYTNQTSSNTNFFLHTQIGESDAPTRGSLTVQGVGANAYGVIFGNIFSEDASTGNMVQGVPNDRRTYTGFLLKSSSSNITGTVAVYAYARS